MNLQPTQQMRQLAAELEVDHHGLRVELTELAASGAMLDARRADNRMFVMAYAPSCGFGVDEVREEDGWQNRYAYTTDSFDAAANWLRELVLSDDTPAIAVSHGT